MAKTWKVTNFTISVLSESNATVIAWWKFNTGGTTDRFDVWWYYYSESQKWWVIAGNSTTQVNSGTNGWFQNVFTAPNDQDATKIKCWVKPIPQTNDKGRYKWSSAGVYSNQLVSPRVTAERKERLQPPATPTGSGTMVNGKPVLAITNSAAYANRTFIYRSVNGGSYTLAAKVNKSVTSWTDKNVSAGNVYRYRLKAALSNGTLSTAYSSVIGPFSTKPTAPTGLTAEARTSTSVRLDWTNTGKTGSWYEVQWSENGDAWKDNDQSAISSSGQIQSTGHFYTVSGLETAKRWYFRVKRGNDAGSSWAIVSGNVTTVSVMLGTVPSAPTLFASTATARTGSTVVFRWIHNSEDGSTQTEASYDGGIYDGDEELYMFAGLSFDSTSLYEVDLSQIPEAQDGTTLRFRVKTKGVVNDYSPWSATQEVAIWSPPTVGIALYDVNDDELDTDEDGYVLQEYPFKVSITAEVPASSSQEIVRSWAYITSNDSYETIGPDGSDMWVAAGEQIWMSDEAETQVNAFDLLLMEGASYTVGGGCLTTMGITAEAEPVILTVNTGASEPPQPFAEFDFDEQNLSMTIKPWCYGYAEGSPDDESTGQLVEGVTLSVYRIGSDGLTTLIADDIENDGEQWVVDPHPSFGTCGYRIMARDTTTGAQVATDGFADTPYDKMVIQWDEDWLNVSDDGVEGEQVVGNRVEIASNINVSEAYKPSVTLKEYDGRRHPVAYYGTQLGQTAKWSGVIVDYYDSDKLDALRRLATYHGDCYVREPSGTGYWANIGNLAIGHQSRSAAVTVSFDVTRIEHEGA